MTSGMISQPVESMLGGVTFAMLRQSGTTTDDIFYVQNNARHLLILVDTRNDLSGIYSITAYGTGGVTTTAFTSTQTGITADVSVTNQLKLHHASRQIRYLDIVLRGSKLQLLE